jgi:hypothetical protein
MPDTIILPLANALLDCLETTATANPDPPAEFCLRVGTLVIHDVDAQSSLDKTCCPGLGYVRLGRNYPSSADFPAPDPRSDKCLSLARVQEFFVGIVRCIPGMGSPEGPTCEDWTAAAIHDADDTQAIWDAVCCWASTDEFKALRSRPFSIVGTDVVQEGDCIERFMTVLVQIPKCPC